MSRAARPSSQNDAAAWGLTTRAAAILGCCRSSSLVSWERRRLVHPIYRFLTAEDLLLEWTQVLAMVAVAVLLAATAVTLASRREWAWVALFSLGALAAIVIVGEEISWGQRLLGIATPPELEEINIQGETNLHNLRGVILSLNFISMVGAGVLTILPLVVAAVRRRGRSIPPWPIASSPRSPWSRHSPSPSPIAPCGT